MTLGGGRPRYSYVLPSYNAAAVLTDSLPMLTARLHDAEVIVVENGSTDDTCQVAERHAGTHDGVEVRILRSARGFGNAIRAGVGASRGELVVATGADLPFELSDLESVERLRDGSGHSADRPPAVYVGSKRHPDSTVEHRPVVRKALTAGFGALRRVLLRSPVRDTQGSLLITGDVARAACSLTREDGFLVTTELIEIAHRSGVTVREVPVEYAADEHPSTVRPVRDSVAMLRGLPRVAARAREVEAAGTLRRFAADAVSTTSAEVR